MEEKLRVTFIGDLKEKGKGVTEGSLRVINALEGKIDLETIDYGSLYKNLPKFIPLKRNIGIFRLNKLSGIKNKIKNKNIHVISPGILDHKLLKYPHKKIITVHDTYVLRDDYPRSLLIKLIKPEKRIVDDLEHLDLYDHIISVSDTTEKQITEKYKLVSKDKVTTLNWNIIPEEFRPLERSKNNGDKVLIGFINNLTWNKREKFKLFVDKFKSLRDNNLEFHFYGPAIDNEIKKLIVDDPRIKYLGFLPSEDVPKVLNSFDVYLSTSTVEGFGLPIMQAKACKVPVLCYDGDIPNIVKRNTLIWNDDNLEEIIKNRSWEKVDVEKAYLDAEECRADKVVPKIIDVYRKVFE